jgi:elongation of very long chain fatty acids protein 6
VNGTVHTIMYFYYFLTELGFRPKGAVVITTIQITQMVIGIIINAFWAHRFFNEGNCQCKSPLLMMSAALVMYASYLYLFLQFFFNKYTASPKKDNAAATKEKKE